MASPCAYTNTRWPLGMHHSAQTHTHSTTRPHGGKHSLTNHFSVFRSAHCSVLAHKDRQGSLLLTHRHPNPAPRHSPPPPSLGYSGWRGAGKVGGWLSPCSLPLPAGSLPLPPIWQSQPAQPCSSSPGFSGQTLCGLVSADAASAAAAAAAAGARRLRATANVADGGQGGRKEAGPVRRPLTEGDKTKVAG